MVPSVHIVLTVGHVAWILSLMNSRSGSLSCGSCAEILCANSANGHVSGGGGTCNIIERQTLL